MKKRVLTLALALTLLCALAAPAGAYGSMGKVGEYTTVSCGDHFTAAIDESGSLWMWGNNGAGQLGNGSSQAGGGSATPTKVLDDVAAVSCGGDHVAAIKTDGTLWTWGSNTFGALGNGGAGDAKSAGGRTIQTVPVQVMENVAAVSCGMSHTAAIQTDGTLWMWGRNRFGELGNGGVGNDDIGDDEIPEVIQTVPVQVLDNVAAVSCGGLYTAAVKTDGTLWMWGDDGDGQLGNGATEKSTTPIQVMDNVAAVSCGERHTAAIKTDGTLWIWGNNWFGQIGNGTKESSTIPVQVLSDVAAVSCGDDYTAIIKTDGTLQMCGSNHFCALGDGTVTSSHYDPVQVLDSVAAVSCGMFHTAAVKTDGTLWTWGWNFYSQMGTNKVNASYDGYACQNTPLKVLDNVKVPSRGTTPAAPAPAPANVAYPSTQSVLVDGVAIEFQCYALKDANGNDTNYIKLRDLADILNGSAAQFEVGWDGNITITTGRGYTKNGTEQNTPFSGQRAYERTAVKTLVNGAETALDTFQLKDDNGGGYTYYKLRDLGTALGITVDWTAERGIFIETE